MKIFWSWQSDTPGKIGRHFVRDTLNEAIKALKEPQDIEEPSERETREALHLDHDRKGVAGSPDLAPTIFRKIEQAAVFVADVTLIGYADATPEGARKPLINSNVAIEYGYALGALGDSSILMVQNVHYGDREALPFDLKHKAGPIQYRLPPVATKAEIDAEQTRLCRVFVDALRPYLSASRPTGTTTKFSETPTTKNIAYFWEPGEVLATFGSSAPANIRHRSEVEDRIEYRFNEARAFYLRLIPTQPLFAALGVTNLLDIAEARQLEVLTRTLGRGMPSRNRFGAITYEPSGMATTPMAFTQLFRNGEIWGVTRELMVQYQGEFLVPMVNVKNIYDRALSNYVRVAGERLGVQSPYEIELGAIGLNGARVSLPQEQMNWSNEVSDPIYENQLQLRRIVNDVSVPSLAAVVNDLIRQLYDLAAVRV